MQLSKNTTIDLRLPGIDLSVRYVRGSREPTHPGRRRQVLSAVAEAG
jgi:hypothetical protein